MNPLVARPAPRPRAADGPRAVRPAPPTAVTPLPHHGVTLRRATVADAQAISDLIAPWARAGVMLPKSPDQIRATVDRFFVAVQDGRVLGSVGLRPVAPHIAEVVALAVHDDAQGCGAGRQLVEAALEAAAMDGYARVYALTLQPGFFERLGFRLGEIQEVPEKVQLDCSSCPRRSTCVEQMMILDR